MTVKNQRSGQQYAACSQSSLTNCAVISAGRAELNKFSRTLKIDLVILRMDISIVLIPLTFT